jgi:nucleoside-triphosphatase THEP1
MENRKIILLADEIGSGKTTLLTDWIKERKDVGGILTPIINGERVFLSVAQKNTFRMLAHENEGSVLRVGKYSFSELGFQKANKEIKKSLQVKSSTYTIIDEIGPLELEKKQGFWPIWHYMLTEASFNYVIIVTRASLKNKIEELLNEHKLLVYNANKQSFLATVKNMNNC